MGFLSRLLGKKPADDAAPPAPSAPLESHVVPVAATAPVVVAEDIEAPAPESLRPLSERNQALKDRIARARASRPPRAEPADVTRLGEAEPAEPNEASEPPEAVAEAVAESSTEADESSEDAADSSAQAIEQSEVPSADTAPKKRRKRKRKAAKQRGANAS